MSLLNVQDFDNIYKFYIRLNNSYEDIQWATLDALAELFDLRLTTYSIFDQDVFGRLYASQVYSRYIRRDILEVYKSDTYKHDVFFTNIDTLLNSKPSSFVYTSDDINGNRFIDSKYGQLLSSIGIKHQALLGGNAVTNMPVHIPCIYKSGDGGGFTQRELELMQFIGRAFSDTMRLYKSYLSKEKIIQATSSLIEMKEIGYVILDHYQNHLSHNNLFITYCSAISEEVSVLSMAHDLLNRYVNNERQNVQIEDCGYLINISCKKLTTPTGLENITLLSLEPVALGKTLDHNRIELMEQYNLTAREAEIMMLIAKGQNSSEIAKALYISLSTVKSHIHNIYIKLEVSTRAELLRKILD